MCIAGTDRPDTADEGQVTMRGAITRVTERALTLAIALAAPACSSEGTFAPVTETEAAEIRAALAGRSFRQFDPSVDGSPRKGVVLDFHDGLGLWAQYSEGNHAIDEWEITSSEYRIEQSSSEMRLHFTAPTSRRILATPCDDCIPDAGISISIQDVFEEDRIRFKLNDPDRVLPSPFPVFTSWTRFREDEFVY